MTSNDVVVTEADLTLIWAALRFWAEEMPVGDDKVIAAYAASVADTESLPAGRLAELLALLGSCRLRYLICTANERLVPDELIVGSAINLRRQVGDGQRIGTLFLKA